MKHIPTGLRYLILFISVVAGMGCGLLQQATTVKSTPIPPGFDPSSLPPKSTAVIQNTAVPAEPSPTVLPEKPTMTPTNSLQPNAFSNGVSFVYDPSLAKGVKAVVVDATGPVSDDQPLFAINPEEDEFDFPGYAAGTNINAKLVVFSVKEYEKLGGDQIVQTVDALKKILAVQPKDISGRIPDLPVGNADRIFHSQLQYLKFQNGSGLRYLTQYAQDVSPISNDRLVYVFQGMTADGAYYVSGMFPITHPSLPENYDAAMKGQDAQKFSENFSNYLLDVQNKLNEQKSDSFTPTLDMLDKMISTLKVDK